MSGDSFIDVCPNAAEMAGGKANLSSGHRVTGTASPRAGVTSAFTLIEVLVVVAIIALLIAILLPSLSRAREQAKAVSCATNLRTTGMAIVYYTQANRDYFPASGQWAEVVRPYLQRGGIKKIGPGGADFEVEFYRCPGDVILAPTGELIKMINGEVVRTNHLVSYAVNDQLIWPLKDVQAAREGLNYELIDQSKMWDGRDHLGNPIWTAMQQISRVKHQAQLVMLTDAGDDEVDTESAYWDFDDALDLGHLPENDPGRLEVHHRRGNNFLFVDQHIQFKKVLAPNSDVPRRGVPRVPWQWIPLDGLQAPAEGRP